MPLFAIFSSTCYEDGRNYSATVQTKVYTFHLNAPQCSSTKSMSNVLCSHQIHFTLGQQMCCLWSSTEVCSHSLVQLTESNANLTKIMKDPLTSWHPAGRCSDWELQTVADVKLLDSISRFWPRNRNNNRSIEWPKKYLASFSASSLFFSKYFLLGFHMYRQANRIYMRSCGGGSRTKQPFFLLLGQPESNFLSVYLLCDWRLARSYVWAKRSEQLLQS